MVFPCSIRQDVSVASWAKSPVTHGMNSSRGLFSCCFFLNNILKVHSFLPQGFAKVQPRAWLTSCSPFRSRLPQSPLFWGPWVFFPPLVLPFCIPPKLLAPLSSSTLAFTVLGNLHPHLSYLGVTLLRLLLYWSLWLLLALNLGCIFVNAASCQTGFARQVQFPEVPCSRR